MLRTPLAIFALLIAPTVMGPCAAHSAETASAVRQADATWVELGTGSGPIPVPDHGQPAHLLRWNGGAILIDVGDGAPEQLSKVGISPSQIETVFISHLHFDHTGGLFALMGLRYQGSPAPLKPLTIYGPPGTKRMVAGLQSAMVPGSTLLPMKPPVYKVVELGNGSHVDLGGLKVTAAENSHYQLWESKKDRPVSLSYNSICRIGRLSTPATRGQARMSRSWRAMPTCCLAKLWMLTSR